MTHGLNYDIEQDYFHWLCEMVSIDQEHESWWILAKTLHSRKFYALVAHDENRAYDGLDLREEYLSKTGAPDYATVFPDETDGECSVFEMLIGLARRMEFETDDPYVYDGDERDRRTTGYWFWVMLDNLDLTRFSDQEYADNAEEAVSYIDWIVDRLLDRRYSANGEGGLFPLNHCHENQCKVEIWYQMSAYLMERNVV